MSSPLLESAKPRLRRVEPDDATMISEIYNHYIVDSIISFEETPVSPDEMRKRILAIGLDHPWWVSEEAGQVTGYAYANRWKERSAYRFALESTVYLHPQACGRGLGSKLYERVIESAREDGFRCLFGGIALPNPASVALHEKLGFRKVAHLQQVGFKLDRWIDVGYWQLLL